jgi:phosphatidylglycerophosphate synthase
MADWLARLEPPRFAVGNPLPSVVLVALLTAALGGILAYLADWAGTYVLAGLAGYAIVSIIVVVRVGFGRGRDGFGIANQVTLLRAGLVCLATGAMLAGGVSSAAEWSLVVLVATALSLDAADGWLARRLRLASDFGARFDLEIDAWLILVLALLVWQSGRVGPWILAIGLMRYVFVLASWYFPALRWPLPPSRRRQVICVQQSVTLLVCLLPPVGGLLANVSAGLALLALLASFASDIIYLVGIRRSPTASGAADRLRDGGAIALSTPDRRDPQVCRTRT